MSYTGDNWLPKFRAFRLAYQILKRMPPDIYFSLSTEVLEFQAGSQEKVKLIRSFFPGCVWKKTFSKSCNWWNYTTRWEGLPIRIYAVSEAPATCRQVEKKRVVKKMVPKNPKAYEAIEYVEVEEEETYTEWECSDGNEVTNGVTLKENA